MDSAGLFFAQKLDSFLLTFIVTGLPITLLTSFLFFKYTWKSLVPSIALIIVLAVIFDIYFDAYLYLIPVIYGLVGGYCVKMKKTVSLFLIVSSLIISTTGSLFFYHAIFNKSTNKTGMIHNYHQKSFETRYGVTGKYSKKEIDEFITIEKTINQAVINHFPSIIFAIALLLGGLTISILKVLFSTLLNANEIKGIEHFRLHDFTIIILIISLAMFISFTYILFDNLYYFIIQVFSLNILFCTLMLFFVQALGIIKYFSGRMNVPGYLIFVLVLLLIVTLQEFFIPLVILLAAIGILDMWADFRKTESNNKLE